MNFLPWEHFKQEVRNKRLYDNVIQLIAVYEETQKCAHKNGRYMSF